MIRLLPLALPLVQSLLAILLCIAPGWLFARRATDDRLTRLLVAVLVSYFIFHLIALTSYAFGLPLQAGPLASLGVSAAAAGAIYFEPERRRDFASSFHVEGLLVWWAVAWFALGLQAALVGCGAGSWGNDWHEHYSRSILFAEHGPPSTTFSASEWTVPARGPLFNSVCAIFLGLFGREFWNYQVFSTVLNTTTVLAIAMALRDFAGVRERSALLLSAIFCALSPFAVTEIAYPWTKLLTVAYILCAVRFLLASLEARREAAPLLWSSFLFALGILTHFYVAIPAALCGLYYVAVRRGAALRPAALAAGLAALTVAPWIAYCLVTFGVAGTFGANSTVRAAQAAGPPYAAVVAENLLSSTFPVSVRHRFSFAQSHTPVLLSADSSGRWTAKEEEQDELTIWMLDLINGNFSILGSLGLAGMFAILLAAVTWDRRGRAAPAPPPPLAGPTSLWVFLLAAGVVLTVMSYPRYADNGLRGAGLHVYIVLMAVLAVRHLRTAPRASLMVLGGLFLVESAIGSGAYLALLSREVPMRLTDAGLVGSPGGAVDPLYIKNYGEKLKAGLIFLSDHLGPGRLPFSILAIVCSLGILTSVAMQPEKGRDGAGLGR